MGGKGGGGGGEPGWAPVWRAEQEKIAKAKADQDAKDTAAKLASDKAAKEQAAADKAAADQADADKAAADKAAADTAAADKAAADKLALETPLGPGIDPGGGIDQPVAGVGDVLGGAVLKPPKYWVGGMDQYASSPQTGKGAGAIKTVQ